ncbi:hypothetical protein [Streptococcus sp. 263_SSPC]|nr:hypothetical protein [Streptococcus sp. 263_SSPC]
MEYFVLNDDNKREPKELFKELSEKCKEEKIKKEKIKEENKQTPAPSES